MRQQHYLELIWYRSLAELRAEAARAYLGVLWWILEPLIYMVVFYLVFTELFQRGGDQYQGDYVSFLLCGLVSWRWFANTIVRGTTAITANETLISQVYLPKSIFPAVCVVTNLVKFLFILALLLGFLAFFGPGIQLTWLALPGLLVTQFVLIAACTAFAAAIVPFLPDLKLVIGNALILMMFLSGIFYDIGRFKPESQFWFRLNPMAAMIEGYRDVLRMGLWPDWTALGIILLCSLVGLWVSAQLLTRYDRVYPKIVLG